MNGNPYGDSIIPTMFDEWTYPGGTTAERMRQWVECGGSSKGIPLHTNALVFLLKAFSR